MENKFTFHSQLEELDTESIYLVHKAKEASQHAYAPYSKFFVGAALLLEDDTLILGSNQENAAYPLCMCAERIALYVAAVQHPEKKIKKIAVIAHKKNHKELVPATCCGACRQVLQEFEQRQQQPIKIVMLSSNHQWISCSSAASLLPFDFNKDHLEP